MCGEAGVGDCVLRLACDARSSQGPPRAALEQLRSSLRLRSGRRNQQHSDNNYEYRLLI